MYRFSSVKLSQTISKQFAVKLSGWRAALLVASVFLGIFLIGFFSLSPSNERNWIPEFAVLPEVSVEGNLIEIRNVRDWRYSAEGVESREYITRTYSLADYERMWLVVEPFGSFDGVAHTYFVFDFQNAEPIAFSIEARREEGEVYQAWKGLLRQYELIYLWGTEADFLIGRSLMKGNQQYLYPLSVSKEFGQGLFLELAGATEALRHSPRFYNTLTSNCTNNLADHANRVVPGAVPWHYARFLTGYTGQLVHKLGYIDSSRPFVELRTRANITQFVQDHADDPHFSQKLRVFRSQ